MACTTSMHALACRVCRSQRNKKRRDVAFHCIAWLIVARRKNGMQWPISPSPSSERMGGRRAQAQWRASVQTEGTRVLSPSRCSSFFFTTPRHSARRQSVTAAVVVSAASLQPSFCRLVWPAGPDRGSRSPRLRATTKRDMQDK